MQFAEAEMVDLLRRRCAQMSSGRRNDNGVRSFARAVNMSPCHISHVLVGRHGVGDELARAMGYQRVVTITYRPAEDSE